MSRPTLATLAGIAFVLAYIFVVVQIPELIGRMYWAAEAVYWGIAGIVWVIPIRWLMLWSVHKR